MKPAGRGTRAEWTYGVPGACSLRCAARVSPRGGPTAYLDTPRADSSCIALISTLGFRDGVAAAATANAGTYAMPDLDITFPHGLGATEVDEAALRALLAFRLTVFAGTADIDTTSEHFPRDDAEMRQGPTRYARAHCYIAAAREAARQRGISCAWTIIDVADVGHDGAKMSAAAAALGAGAARFGTVILCR